MTLIVTFPVVQGFVVAADTEENCPSYDVQGNYFELRKSVQKIKPEPVGNFQFAIAGAGHAGLIEAFIVRAKRAVVASPERSANALHDILETALDQFFRNDVTVCQDADKEFKLFVPYFCPHTKEYGVWVSEQILLREVVADRPELIGWEHQLYNGLASRLFRPDLTIAQAILAALYVLKIGDETSNYIKEPFHVAVIRDNGIWMEEAGYIKTMSDRLESFEKGINELFLACADTGISPERFKEVLTEFGEQASSLHKQHLEAVVQRFVAGGLIMNSPYPPIPPGTMIRLHADGSFDADYDIDARKRLADIVRVQHGSVPEPLRSDAEEIPPTPSDSETSEGQP